MSRGWGGVTCRGGGDGGGFSRWEGDKYRYSGEFIRQLGLPGIKHIIVMVKEKSMALRVFTFCGAAKQLGCALAM